MQNGIALLQVLLITAVLSLLGLFMTKTARQQVYIASAFEERAQAVVANYDAEAIVLFGLLTESKSPTSTLSSELSELTGIWNFYGKPFNYTENTKIVLQDLRGLLNLSFPVEQRWLRVLTKQGLTDYDARLIVNKIKDWQDVDKVSRYSLPEGDYKNGTIQTLAELNHIDMPEAVRQFLNKSATINKMSIFNPMTAPDMLLAALYDAPIAEQLIILREGKKLTPTLFSTYVRTEPNSDIMLYPSNNYRLTIETDIGHSRVNRTLYYLLESNKPKPVNLVASEG